MLTIFELKPETQKKLPFYDRSWFDGNSSDLITDNDENWKQESEEEVDAGEEWVVGVFRDAGSSLRTEDQWRPG